MSLTSSNDFGVNMNVLHVASFNGNVGDNAHHNGFRASFKEVFGNVSWTDLEIRKFYQSWGQAKFDNTFVELTKQFDAIIIGGGNFFEVCHDYSVSGCTIDISNEILEKIDVPVMFNALGFDTKKGATEDNLFKFKGFITSVLKKPNMLVSFRNDGSVENYIDAYGELDTGIHKIPDGGFFIELKDRPKVCKNLVGVNLACDMIDIRLKGRSYDDFLNELLAVYESKMEEGIRFRFFPHILTDLKIIYDLLSKMKDINVKYNVEVMPYLTGQGCEEEIFSKYYECKLVTGMRFHTNVCAFGLGKKTIPLVSYPKIGDLYEDIGQGELTINVNESGYDTLYQDRITEALKEDYDNSAIISQLKIKQIDIIKKFKAVCTAKNSGYKS